MHLCPHLPRPSDQHRFPDVRSRLFYRAYVLLPSSAEQLFATLLPSSRIVLGINDRRQHSTFCACVRSMLVALFFYQKSPCEILHLLHKEPPHVSFCGKSTGQGHHHPRDCTACDSRHRWLFRGPAADKGSRPSFKPRHVHPAAGNWGIIAHSAVGNRGQRLSLGGDRVRHANVGMSQGLCDCPRSENAFHYATKGDEVGARNGESGLSPNRGVFPPKRRY